MDDDQRKIFKARINLELELFFRTLPDKRDPKPLRDALGRFGEDLQRGFYYSDDAYAKRGVYYSDDAYAKK